MGLKIKIIRVYEKNDTLRIETECKYGKDNIGLNCKAKYLDPVTDKPRYLKEVKDLLEKKYNKELAKEKPIKDSIVGKEIDLDSIK